MVGLTTDQIKCTNYWEEKTICQRQSWLGADEKLAKSSLWDVITSVPMDNMKKVSITESFPEDQKQMFVTSMNNERVRNDGVFLQSKKDPGLVLYPELQLIRKRRGQDVTFWGEDAKQWILSQVCPTFFSLIVAIFFSLLHFLSQFFIALYLLSLSIIVHFVSLYIVLFLFSLQFISVSLTPSYFMFLILYFFIVLLSF